MLPFVAGTELIPMARCFIKSGPRIYRLACCYCRTGTSGAMDSGAGERKRKSVQRRRRVPVLLHGETRSIRVNKIIHNLL